MERWEDELQIKVEMATGNKTPGEQSKKSRTKKCIIHRRGTGLELKPIESAL